MSSSKKRAAVQTNDRMLFQKIKLELYGYCETFMVGAELSARDFDVIFTDVDSYPDAPKGYTMSREAPCDLPLPFRLGAAERLARSDEKRTEITLDEARRSVTLKGRTIRLTDVEFALCRALIRRRGGYASREELLSEVWSPSTDAGVINVYIHYLREKLETDGEKVILSSRNLGYCIDEKYFSEVGYAENN